MNLHIFLKSLKFFECSTISWAYWIWISMIMNSPPSRMSYLFLDVWTTYEFPISLLSPLSHKLEFGTSKQAGGQAKEREEIYIIWNMWFYVASTVTQTWNVESISFTYLQVSVLFVDKLKFHFDTFRRIRILENQITNFQQNT